MKLLVVINTCCQKNLLFELPFKFNSFEIIQARRALRALRGLVRLKSLMEGPIVKRQTTSTLRSMQTLSRVHSQIRSRRIRMLEENQALQRQLLQKHAKELESMRVLTLSQYLFDFLTYCVWIAFNLFQNVIIDWRGMG